MKKTLLSLFFLTGTAVVTVCSGQTASTSGAGDNSVLTNDRARESYALGMYMGQAIKRSDVDLDLSLVLRGISDEQSSNTLMTDEQMMTSFAEFRKAASMAQQKERAEEGEKNKEAGAAFLADNKTKPGVVTLPDGLQYKIISQGTGPIPGPTDIVTVNYKGMSTDGKEFDSSAKAGHPAQFPVGRVIHGWTEALEKMPVGSKWELFIPSDLAYGPMGRPPVIQPNETLVFDVELLSAQAAPPPAPHQPLTSDIIRVPSAEEMKNGAKVETIKASDLPKMQQSSTN